MTAALLEAEGASVALGGETLLAELTFSAGGERVLCVGEVEPLFSVLTGVPALSPAPSAEAEGAPSPAYVTRGEIRLLGRRVGDPSDPDLPLARSGAAPLDPPMPAAWTSLEYVTWSARLGGAPRRRAQGLARASLAGLGASALEKRQAGTLLPVERRAVVLAAAVVLAPEVLVAYAPFSGLSGPPLALMRETLSRATLGRAVVLLAPGLEAGSPEAELASHASHLLVFSRGGLAFSGSPAEIGRGARVFRLAVLSGAEAFAAELAREGIALSGGPHHFAATLPEGKGPRELLASAARARAAVVEMMPVYGG